MKLTKVLFLFLVFSLMFFLLANLVQYLGSTREARIAGKLVLVFGVYAEFIVNPESLAPNVLETLPIFSVIVLVLVVFVLMVNVIVQAMVRRWRPLKTLISFYIPISLIPSPLIMSWWIIGYLNATSSFYSFMIFVYTSLAMIYARSTLGRHTKIKASETGVCVLFRKLN